MVSFCKNFYKVFRYKFPTTMNFRADLCMTTISSFLIIAKSYGKFVEFLLSKSLFGQLQKPVCHISVKNFHEMMLEIGLLSRQFSPLGYFPLGFSSEGEGLPDLFLFLSLCCSSSSLVSFLLLIIR